MACKQNLDLRCVLISDPSTLGAGAKTRLESRIKKFTPHCIYRPTIPQRMPHLQMPKVPSLLPRVLILLPRVRSLLSSWTRGCATGCAPCSRSSTLPNVRRLSPFIFLPHFRLYEVIALHMCILPYKYRKIMEMLLKFTFLRITKYTPPFTPDMSYFLTTFPFI